MKKWLSSLPPYLLSGGVLLAIFWLTLSPKPLGENPPPMFPGADKLAHAIMFGAFSVSLLLDWQRKHYWEAVDRLKMIICASFSALLGCLIEYLQSAMDLGRSFEWEDIVADIGGAYIFSYLYVVSQKFWFQKS